MKKHSCSNNAAQKSAEVAEGMRRVGNYNGMTELYRRGCFRHIFDVAYARIALERFGDSIDRVAAHLDSLYEGPQKQIGSHRCDRVFPPS